MNKGFGIEYLYRDMVCPQPAGTRVGDEFWRKPLCPVTSMLRITSTTDCRSLWDYLQSCRLPEEQNLWPGITFLKETFLNGTIREHYWTDTEHTVADALTKLGRSPDALMMMMHGDWLGGSAWRKATLR